MITSTAYADNVAKNATTSKKYDTLNAAFAEASSGDVIELLQGYDATGESGYHGNANSRYIGFDKSLTIEGNGNTLTVRGRGIAFGQYARLILHRIRTNKTTYDYEQEKVYSTESSPHQG